MRSKIWCDGEFCKILKFWVHLNKTFSSLLAPLPCLWFTHILMLTVQLQNTRHGRLDVYDEVLQTMLILAEMSKSVNDMGAFSCQKNSGNFFLQRIFFATFTTLIRSTKYKLLIKLITRMDKKSRDESIRPN